MELEEIHRKLTEFKNSIAKKQSNSDELKGRRATKMEQLQELGLSSLSAAGKEIDKLKRAIPKRESALVEDVQNLMNELEGKNE